MTISSTATASPRHDLQLIAAVDADWGLGRQGQLLAYLSPDLRRFRQLTLGHTIILGRRTLATFPQGQPLNGRDNIILSRNADFQVAGALTVHSLAELWTALASSTNAQTTLVCGGAQVYAQLLPYCSYAYITRLHHRLGADCHLPRLDTATDWQLMQAGERQQWQDIEFSFEEYARRQ